MLLLRRAALAGRGEARAEDGRVQARPCVLRRGPGPRAQAEKETAVALIERGWEVSKSAGDAAEWNADDLDDDF